MLVFRLIKQNKICKQIGIDQILALQYICGISIENRDNLLIGKKITNQIDPTTNRIYLLLGGLTNKQMDFLFQKESALFFWILNSGC